VNRTATNAAAQHTLTAASTRTATDEPALKHALVDLHLRSIVKVVRGLHGTVPGIGVLKMPNGHLRNAALIDFASAFATQAAVYASILTEHGLPADFVTQLRSAIDAFQSSIGARGAARNNVRGASKSIQNDIALGRRIITVLDGVISRHLVGSAHDLAVWAAAKRVGSRTTSGQGFGLVDEPIGPLNQPTSPVVQSASPVNQQAA
jgi:hypothetical protein